MAASRGFKGVRERLVASIKSAATDYKNAAKDTVVAAKEKPLKSLFYAGLFSLGVQLNRTNPNKNDYHDAIVEEINKMVLLSDKIRNKDSDKHLQLIGKHFARGQIRHQSLIFFSLIYYSDYDENSRYYESQCKYVQPKWSEFHTRILDFGLCGRWWVLRYNTTDYDVNFEELPKDMEGGFDKVKDFGKRLLGMSYFGNPAVPMYEQRKVKKAVEVVE